MPLPKPDFNELPPDEWWNAHALAASLVPRGSRVLDIGCGWGGVARYLKQRDCTVVGVEPDVERLATAAQVCDLTYEGTTDTLESLGLEHGSFDAVLFADVLEHVPDPWTTLREIRRYLKPEGRVVISIPNVANYAARLNLLKGEFRYQDFGLYDRTHLRFFTRATFQEMVHSAGLELVAERFTPNLTESGAFRRTLGRIGAARGFFRKLDRNLTYRHPALFAVQFIVACQASGADYSASVR